jgi:PTS system nitrogen regulatory IIA component
MWIEPSTFADRLEFVVREAIVPDLPACGREQAIRLLVDRLAKAGWILGGEELAVADAVVQRELQGSMRVAPGVAIPHAQHAGVRDLRAAVGYCPQGIDYQDGVDQPVQWLFLVVAPPYDQRKYLRAMAAIAREVRDHLLPGGLPPGHGPPRTEPS